MCEQIIGYTKNSFSKSDIKSTGTPKKNPSFPPFFVIPFTYCIKHINFHKEYATTCHNGKKSEREKKKNQQKTTTTTTES